MQNQSPFSGMSLNAAPPPQSAGQVRPQLNMPVYERGVPSGAIPRAPRPLPVQQRPNNTQQIMDQIRLARSRPAQQVNLSNRVPENWNGVKPDVNPFSAEQLAGINRAFQQYQQQQQQPVAYQAPWAQFLTRAHQGHSIRPFNFTG